jgi:hypothetical protein
LPPRLTVLAPSEHKLAAILPAVKGLDLDANEIAWTHSRIPLTGLKTNVVLAEAMKSVGAKTKREAVVTAVERFNRLKRLEKLNARVRGQFRDFMTQAELKVLRAADIPKRK